MIGIQNGSNVEFFFKEEFRTLIDCDVLKLFNTLYAVEGDRCTEEEMSEWGLRKK